MKRVSILVPESSVLQAIADPQYLFSAVNQFMMAAGKSPLFEVQLVGLQKEVKLNNGLFSVNTSKLLEDVAKTDQGYLEWLLAQKLNGDGPDEDWIYTLKHYLGK